MRPSPLPAHLLSTPFLRSDALIDGVSEDRLRARDLDRSVRGVRNTRPAVDLVDRCALFATRLRSEIVFSHGTAALLWGGPLPPALANSEILDITVPAPEPSPHARGLRGHSRAISDEEIAPVAGLRVTTRARTWWDLASTLPLADLVALGDHFVRADPGIIDDLTTLIEGKQGQRGARRARCALALIDPRAESAPESRLRVILAEGGFPRPEVNYEVHIAGRHYRLDLAFVEEKVALEYQGDYHRSRDQWRKDLSRRSLLESVGWTIVELGADDLRDPRELCARVARMLVRPGA